MNSHPICHYCEEKHHIRKHGKSRAGITRYRCCTCNRTFQSRYIYHGNESNINRLIAKMLTEGNSHPAIASQLGIGLDVITRHILMMAEDE